MILRKVSAAASRRAFFGGAAALSGLAALGFSTDAAHAQTAPTGFVLPGSEYWDMHAAHGRDYRIYVSRPAGDPPEGGFPVLYVLDGNALFPIFAEGRRLQSVYEHGLHNIIIVGIGYPNDEMYDVRRLADFTGPNPNPLPPAQQPLAEYEAGQRDAFLTFIMQQVRPEIARRYPINVHRQSLYGHSLGGLFALHTLYSQPRAFHAIIAASATIWWSDQAIVADEARFATRLARDPSLGRGARLLLLIGELEEDRVDVGDNVALARRLERLSAYGLRSSIQFYEGETHMSVPIRSVTDTLRLALQWP